MSLDRLGLIKTSLIDYPGEVAAVIFTAGCNLRCPFCQNPELLTGEYPPDFVTREEVAGFLRRREQVLGGVCFTGGEPLLQGDLAELADLVHQLGFKVKLDTNGTFPEKLSGINPDFVALDIKTSPHKYDRLFPNSARLQLDLDLFDETPDSVPDVWLKVLATLEWISNADIEFEIRTTVVPGLVTVDDMKTISGILARDYAGPIKQRGRYVLAGFKPENALDPAFARLQPYSEQVIEQMAEIVRNSGIDCSIRSHHLFKPD